MCAVYTPEHVIYVIINKLTGFLLCLQSWCRCVFIEWRVREYIRACCIRERSIVCKPNWNPLARFSYTGGIGRKHGAIRRPGDGISSPFFFFFRCRSLSFSRPRRSSISSPRYYYSHYNIGTIHIIIVQYTRNASASSREPEVEKTTTRPRPPRLYNIFVLVDNILCVYVTIIRILGFCRFSSFRRSV